MRTSCAHRQQSSPDELRLEPHLTKGSQGKAAYGDVASAEIVEREPHADAIELANACSIRRSPLP